MLIYGICGRMYITVYWGCTINSKFPQIKSALRKILKASGLDFKEFSEDFCCGLPLILSGNQSDASRWFKNLISKLIDVDTILTPCAGCYATFTKRYQKTLGSKVPFKVLHSTQLMDQLISKGQLKLEGKDEISVVFHDPCELGRRCGIYEDPRRVLRSIPKVRLIEADFSGERSNCCGGGGLLPSSFPDLAIEIALQRISRDLALLKPNILVTCCPSCYLNFSRAMERSEFGIRLLDIVEIVAEHMV